MTAQEIRELDTEALLAKVEEYKKELFGLRFQQATGQLEKLHVLDKFVKQSLVLKQ